MFETKCLETFCHIHELIVKKSVKKIKVKFMVHNMMAIPLTLPKWITIISFLKAK